MHRGSPGISLNQGSAVGVNADISLTLIRRYRVASARCGSLVSVVVQKESQTHTMAREPLRFDLDENLGAIGKGFPRR